jgi:hypothetical protein
MWQGLLHWLLSATRSRDAAPDEAAEEPLIVGLGSTSLGSVYTKSIIAVAHHRDL